MADPSYRPKVYKKQGGEELVIASGGKLVIESGGVVELAGVDITALLAAGATGPTGAAGATGATGPTGPAA